MVTIRRTAWFFVLAVVMAGWMGVLGSFRGVAEASVIASHGGAGDLRAAEIAKVQTVLEQKVVMQKLLDYGVSSEEAMAKVRSMSDSDLHRLATLADRVAAGADGGVGFADRIGGPGYSDPRHPDAHEQTSRCPLKNAFPLSGAVLPMDGAFFYKDSGNGLTWALWS